MKKLLILLITSSLFLATQFSSKAQTLFTGTTTNPTGAVLNATVDTLDLTMSGGYNAVMTVQAYLVKTSGTIAGTMRLYGSNFKLTGAWAPVGDTATLTNAATNQKVWTITQPAYKYYRVLQDGGTTMAGTLYVRAFGIKPN